MDCNFHIVPQRTGHHYGKEVRTSFKPRSGFFSGFKSGGRWYRPKSKRIPQAEGERKRRENPAEAEHRRRGSADGNSPSLPAIKLLDQSTTFITWSLCLSRWILATKTDFARHLAASFSVTRCSSVSSTAALPLPLPFPGCFAGGGPKLSKKRLRILAQKRVAHVLVIIIDFLYLGRFATLEELGRHPAELQKRCLRSIYSFVVACGSRPAEFPVPPGRSGAELIACLDSLERFLETSGVGKVGYDTALRFRSEVKQQEERNRLEHPTLQPFRALDHRYGQVAS